MFIDKKIKKMKKLFLIAFAGLLTAGAFAQTTTPVIAKTDKQKDMHDLRKDVREEGHDRKLRKYELKHHDVAEAKKETKDIKGDNKEIRSDVKDLRKDGVKHPIKRAHKHIHRQHIKTKH